MMHAMCGHDSVNVCVSVCNNTHPRNAEAQKANSCCMVHKFTETECVCVIF